MNWLNLALVVVGPPAVIGGIWKFADWCVHQHASKYSRDVRKVHAPRRPRQGVRR